MFNNWPYTNLNELNLDWILQQVKGIDDKYKDLDSTISAGVEAVQQQEAASLQDMDNMKMTIISAINGARDIAIVDVNATKTNALNDIETDKTNALTAIAALGNTWDEHYESLIAEMPADLASLTQTLAILGRILTGESEQTVTFFMGDYAGGSKTDPAPTSTSDVSTNMIIGGAGFKFAFTLDENVDADTKIYAIRWFEGKNAETGVYTDEHVVSCGNVRTYTWTVPDTCYGFSITLRNSDTLFTEAPASDIVTLRWYTAISDFVSVDGDQDFTDEQKAQGRENIGAASENDITELKSAFDDIKSPSDDLNIIYSDVRPDNLYDPNTAIEGYYINSTGVQTASSDWWCTPFIEIGEYSQIQFYNVGLSAWYDENQTFASSFTGGNSIYDVPANAKYVRCSILTANVPIAIISYNTGRYSSVEDRQVAHWVNPKKAYQKGYIRFTVPVNQTVATYDNTDEENHEGTPSYVDVDCVLTLPYEYKPVGKPCKLIMMCHGAGKGVSGTDNWTENTGYNALVGTFMTRGYAVFDCNGFKNDALGWSFWGNQRGLEAWRKAYLYVTDNYNVEKTFSIYAFSMGGLTAMNLAFQGFPNINAIALGSPVLNLEKVFESTDGTANILKTVYGLGDTWDDSKVIGDNPWKRIISINGVDMLPYKMPPVKIWYGSTETGNTGNPAVEKEFAKQFVNALTACGQYAYYREVSGSGHEICYGNSIVVNTEILTFLQRYEMMRSLYAN